MSTRWNRPGKMHPTRRLLPSRSARSPAKITSGICRWGVFVRKLRQRCQQPPLQPRQGRKNVFSERPFSPGLLISNREMNALPVFLLSQSSPERSLHPINPVRYRIFFHAPVEVPGADLTGNLPEHEVLRGTCQEACTSSCPGWEYQRKDENDEGEIPGARDEVKRGW